MLLPCVLVGLAGSYFCVMCSVRNVRDLRMGLLGPLPMIVAVCIGVALARACYSTSYADDATFRIEGIPFPEAVFERHGVGWIDYVGPLTLVSSVANALFGLLIPQCFLRIYGRATRQAAPSREA
jgi:hypothetical protein